MKSTNTVSKLFSSVFTLAVVGCTVLNGMAWGQTSVLAWGYNDNGQCNIPDSANSGVTAIAGGYGHTIALKGGAVLAWGYNGYGECTIPSYEEGVSLLIARLEYDKCKEIQLDPKDTGVQKTGTSPE